MTRHRFALMRKFEVLDSEGNLYLRRWRIIETPWFGIFLHKIASPDKDRDLHDHPWSFVSVVLRGGYVELLPMWPAAFADSAAQREAIGACVDIDPRELRAVRRGWLSIAFRRATAAHRITRLLRTPTWTLVFIGPRRRSWGFYTNRGYIDWRTYLGLPSEA